MTILLSDIYDVVHNTRGKAAEGFIRPTLGESFVSHRDFKEVASRYMYLTPPGGQNTLVESNKVQLTTEGEYTLTVTKDIIISCKLWGAAGGGPSGGVGGFTSGTTELHIGTTYKIWVGGGGIYKTAYDSGSSGGFGGGGLCGKANNFYSWANRASGGGLTGIFMNTVVQGNALLIAGAGGGGYYYTLTAGGNGGGLTGGAGAAAGNSGGGAGGTQLIGGAKGADWPAYPAGATAGSALQGGKGATNLTTKYSGSGGGSGYFGGGGGGGNDTAGGYGGGGSSFIHSTLVTNGSTLRLAERGGVVPNNTDPDYTNNAGSNSALIGAPGLFVIEVVH